MAADRVLERIVTSTSTFDTFDSLVSRSTVETRDTFKTLKRSNVQGSDTKQISFPPPPQDGMLIEIRSPQHTNSTEKDGSATESPLQLLRNVIKKTLNCGCISPGQRNQYTPDDNFFQSYEDRLELEENINSDSSGACLTNEKALDVMKIGKERTHLLEFMVKHDEGESRRNY